MRINDERAFNFTTERLRALPPADAGGRVEYRDTGCPGLVLRVTDTGAKTFSAYRWVPARQRPERVTIGRFSASLGIDAARKRTRAVLAQIGEGRSPAAERRQLNDEYTLQELFDRYMREHIRKHLKPKQIADTEAMWSNHVTPAKLASRKLRDITRYDIEQLHTKIGAKHPRTANKVTGLIKALFARADQWGANVKNPATGIRQYANKSRERFLQPDEMPAFLQALAATEQPWQDMFRMLMLTGVRLGNLCAAHFEQFDLQTGVWHVPGSEHKNKSPHAVPLLPEAIEIVKRRRAVVAKGIRWLWPSDTSETGHVVSVRKRWVEMCERAGIENLTRHDIRRTMGSYISITGGSIQAVGKALGHKTIQASAVYARLNIDPVRDAIAKAMGAVDKAGNATPQ